MDKPEHFTFRETAHVGFDIVRGKKSIFGACAEKSCLLHQALGPNMKRQFLFLFLK